MNRDEEIVEWRKTRLLASTWYCGDDYCNCAQPLVERITPNVEAGFPWIRRERLWAGEFKTDGLWDGMEEELAAEAARRGLPVDVLVEEVRKS